MHNFIYSAKRNTVGVIASGASRSKTIQYYALAVIAGLLRHCSSLRPFAVPRNDAHRGHVYCYPAMQIDGIVVRSTKLSSIPSSNDD